MKVYVEAFYEDGTRKLGNLDGQGVITAKDYRKTNMYKALKRGRYPHPDFTNGRVVSTAVHHWVLVSPNGVNLETIYNPCYVKPGSLANDFKEN